MKTELKLELIYLRLGKGNNECTLRFKNHSKIAFKIDLRLLKF